MLLIAVVLFFPVFSCKEGISVDVYPETAENLVRFTFGGTATKTEFGSPDGNVYSVLWTDSQKVGIFYNSQFGSPEDNYGAQYVFPVPAADRMTAAFTAPFMPEEGSRHVFYAISPLCSLGWMGNEDRDADGINESKVVYAEIPVDQVPVAGSCDEKAQVIVARREYPDFPNEVEMPFTHLSAYGKINSLILPEGSDEIVGVLIESNRWLSGEVYYNYDKPGNVSFNRGDKYLYLDVNSGGLKGKSLKDVFFACVPQAEPFSEGDYLKFTVYTIGDTWEKTVSFTEDRTLTFNAGHISSFSLDASGFVNKSRSGYRLVWHDEFDGEPEAGISWAWPSSEWIFETGGSGWGNDEAQYYVNKVHGDKVVSKIKDGNLIITAYKLAVPLNGMDYISARMTTSQSWTYGNIEMRAKLPSGRGVWPAFWMLPEVLTSDNLLDGEIDIMEYVGYEPGVVWFSLHNKNDRTEEGKNLLTCSYSIDAPEDAFHVYGVVWTPEYIQAYIDGTPYFKFDNDGSGNPESWPFDKPFNIKLNIAVGGNWGGYMGIDDNIFPAEYVIDYVRVYQL